MIFQSNNFSNFLIKYRLIIMPLVPLVFFIVSLMILLPPTLEDQEISNSPSPTEAPDNFGNVLSPDLAKEIHDAEIEKPLDSFAGFQKLESLPDGTNLYTYSSPVPSRANIIISAGEDNVLFQRNITHPKFPVKISNYTNVYGPANWIFKGSIFYGLEFNTYIYPKIGIAFIGNPKTGEVSEQHVFKPMEIDEYVEKYGEDIPSQP